MSRPIPKALKDDPRKFQIGQVERRFKGERSERDDSTVLTFKMEPSDPDFPYEIEALECELSIPSSYPVSGQPTLVVRNKDIPRGFQINIEKGFDSMFASAPNLTLLGLMNRLDKQLEAILSGRIAETIKIVAPKGQPSAKVSTSSSVETNAQIRLENGDGKKAIHTSKQIEDAKLKRQSDIRQLEARFGRLQSFFKSSDGSMYTVPLESPKRSTWPTELQQLSVAQITVPERYPLKPAELRLNSESKAARNAEDAFKQRSERDATATITQFVNYLSLHLKEMSVRTPETSREQTHTAPQPVEHQSHPAPTTAGTTSAMLGDDRSHIKHIRRPPEWDAQFDADESSDNFSENASESEDESDEETKDLSDSSEKEQPTSQVPAERGILLSFPHLELHGIELLELTSLHVSVKCERCKEITDVEKLRSSPENSTMRELSCRKCAAGLSVRFRVDMIHANSLRAGYLDLEGCTVADMLPR